MSRPFFNTWYCPKDQGLAMIEQANITPQSNILEPSAGEGRLADLIYTRTKSVTAIELHVPHFKTLNTKPYRTLHKNFLLTSPDDIGVFSHIISCPPFDTTNHLNHMKQFLQPNGYLVALVMGNLLNYFWLQFYTELNLDFEAPDGRKIPCGLINYSHSAN